MARSKDTSMTRPILKPHAHEQPFAEKQALQGGGLDMLVEAGDGQRPSLEHFLEDSCRFPKV